MPRTVLRITLVACMAAALACSPAERPRKTVAPPTEDSNAPSSPGARRPGEPWVSEPLDLGEVIDWDADRGPWAGFRRISGTTASYNLTLHNLAVEQFEDGKPATRLWDRWSITCREPSAGGPRVYCNITILKIINWGRSGPTVTSADYSTVDDSLAVLRADWSAGALDLRMQYPFGDREDIELRFDYDGNTIYLKSLRGLQIVRSSSQDDRLVNVEHRLAPYTKTLNVPLEMRGLKSAGSRRWHAWLSSLTEDDRSAWRELSARRASIPEASNEIETRVRALVKDYDAVSEGKREMTPEEDRAINRIVREVSIRNLQQFFAASKLSTDAQRRALEIVRTTMEDDSTSRSK